MYTFITVWIETTSECESPNNTQFRGENGYVLWKLGVSNEILIGVYLCINKISWNNAYQVYNVCDGFDI